MALSNRGFTVIDSYPTSGWDAVDAVLEHKPDTALLDYWLLGTQGSVAAAAIRRRAAQQKILIMGRFCGHNEINNVLHSGAVGFVTKATSMDGLVAAIEAAAEGSCPVADPTAQATVDDVCRDHPGELGGWDCSHVAILQSLGSLSRREMEVLELVALGIHVDDIAVSLDVKPATVRSHIDNIFSKTETRSQVELVGLARRHGAIQA